MTQMRVLVTGAAGFVGNYMLTELAENGYEPVGLDYRAADGGPKVKWFTCDLLDRAAIDAVLTEVEPEACIHLAGIAFVPAGTARPDSMLSVNVVGALNLLDSLRALRPRTRVICASTAHVYGQCFHNEKAVDENSPLRPVTLYAISKAAADLAALGYAESWDMPVMTVRPNNHTGPGQSGQFVVPGLVAQAKSIAAGKAQPVIRAGNMESERDFTDVRDVVRSYRLLIEKGRPGLAYNIGSGTTITVGEVLDRICRLLDIHPEIEVDENKFRPKDRSPILNTARIEEHTGWHPEIDLDRTLRDMLEEGQNHR